MFVTYRSISWGGMQGGGPEAVRHAGSRVGIGVLHEQFRYLGGGVEQRAAVQWRQLLAVGGQYRRRCALRRRREGGISREGVPTTASGVVMMVMHQQFHDLETIHLPPRRGGAVPDESGDPACRTAAVVGLVLHRGVAHRQVQWY